MTNQPISAAIYLRQSKDTDGAGLAVERQRTACEELAAARGWAITATYTDNDRTASDRRKARPEYDRMVADYQAGRFDAIVCWDLDRLTRQPRQLEDWIDAAEERGLVIATANGEADLGTDGGRLFARIKASVSRGEIERKSARQRARNAQDRAAGKPPARPAFGYTPDGLHIDPVAGPAVQAAFAAVLAGTSISEITRTLNAGGHRTALRPGPGGKVSGGGPWRRSNVLHMAKNARYAGVRTRDTRQPGGGITKVEVGPGCWPALVDRATFDAVQLVLDSPDRVSNRVGTARKWLGGGLFRCGICDSDVKTGYRGGGERVYMCRKASHLSRRADPVDALVLEVVAGRLSMPDARQLLAPDEPAAVAAAREDARAARARIDALALEYADGLLTGRQLQVATQRLEAKVAAADAVVAAAARGTALDTLLGAPDPAAAFTGLPLGAQRGVVDTLLTVVLRRREPGAGRRFDPTDVEIVWR